jgi:exopolysaccharide biosynthesis polyprenyl glycosylphosphotransferase
MAIGSPHPSEIGPTAAAPARDVLIAPTARNAAILRMARELLAATLAETNREAAIRSVERAADAAPKSRMTLRLWSRWVWRSGTLFAMADAAAVTAAWLALIAPVALPQLAASAFAVFVIGNRTDLHRSRLQLSVLDDVPAYLLAAVTASFAIALTGAVYGDQTPTSGGYLAFGGLCFFFLVAGRMCSYAVVRRLRSSRLAAHPVIIVGAGDVGQRLAEAMLAHPEYGLAAVGFIDSDPPERRAAHSVLPLLGGLSELPDALRRSDVHDVVFAFGAQPDAQLVRVVRACVRMDMQVFVVPRYFELYGADRRGRIEMVWGVPLLRIRRWSLRPSRASLKRALDIGLAAVGLLVLSPLMAGCALAVRVDGGPGVVFRQKRVGRNGEVFTLLKFRSMRPTGDDSDLRWSIEGDAGISRVGRFLRRTSLDELPQLINVLRGDMSLVGPRPERPYFVQNFDELFGRYGDRLRIAGGLTGWAQVNGLRGDTSIHDRVMFDNYYIDNWSLWSDIKIMLRTVPAMVRRTPNSAAGRAARNTP